jgi:hypothetical protein
VIIIAGVAERVMKHLQYNQLACTSMSTLSKKSLHCMSVNSNPTASQQNSHDEN